jgi:hypothetical protein
VALPVTSIDYMPIALILGIADGILIGMGGTLLYMSNAYGDALSLFAFLSFSYLGWVTFIFGIVLSVLSAIKVAITYRKAKREAVEKS